MSKGGAGKVYFVLYLAVVLELLIIIVERDEAEEHLHQKQKEAMKIVESILSQLQSGAGSEGVNTRPQDEITLKPEGMDDKAIKDAIGIEIKPNRKYVIDVGVTNIASELKKREGENNKEYEERVKKLVELSNVSDLEYQVYYNSNPEPNNCPLFPSDEDFKDKYAKVTAGQDVQSPDGQNWKLMSVRKLAIDKPATFATIDMNNLAGNPLHPLYSKPTLEGTSTTPNGVSEDSVFYYSREESMKVPGSAKNGLDKRSFVVNFQPPNQGGWYKLRFASRTNKIMGVKKEGNENKKIDDVEDEIAINIGTVQLKAGELKKVVKEVQSDLEPFGIPKEEELKNPKEFNKKIADAIDKAAKDPKALEIKSKIKLYGYIVKLLSPGQSVTFDQNQGSIQFNIRVLKPDVKTAKPSVNIAKNSEGEIHKFEGKDLGFKINLSPYQKNNNKLTIELTSISDPNKKITINKTAEQLVGPEKLTALSEGKSFDVSINIPDYIEGTSSINSNNYKLSVKHDIGSEKSSDEAKVFIYSAKSSKNIDSWVDKSIKSKLKYGNSLKFTFEPLSGKKIPQNEFKYEIKTDKNIQSTNIQEFTFDGLSSANSPFPICEDYSIIQFRLYWTDPISGTQVNIIPNLKFDKIKLGEPDVIFNSQALDISGTKNVRCMMPNIEILAPKLCKQNAKLGEPTVDVKLDVPGYTILNSSIEENPTKKGTYNVVFEISGKPNKKGMVEGTADISIKCSATAGASKSNAEVTQSVQIIQNVKKR